MRSYPTLRRALVLIACAAALTVASAAPASAAGFKYGVAAAEVTSSSALLWTRSDKSGTLKLVIATNPPTFSDKTTIGGIQAKAANDNTVSVLVKKLKPGKTYYYHFSKGKTNTSTTGKFRTAPKSDAAKAIHFAISGDTDAERAIGKSNIFYNGLKGNNGLGAMNFGVYKQMALEKNDFNVNLGDTIYSDSEVPGHPLAVTVPAKRKKYKLNLAVPNLQLMRASAAGYNQWDDHEFRNDFSKPEHGAQIYKNGVKAFREFMPVKYTNAGGTYAHQRWGKNLEVFRLDERSFRSAKASANHTCDNPDTGQPDLAPTAPQSTRSLFAVLVPSLNQPVSQACKNKINDPKRTYLGKPQLQRFLKDVKASKAKFKVILNELPIQQFYALPYDRWEGYEFERKQVLHSLQNAGVKNLVWLATDVHANLVNVVRYKTLENGGPQDSPYKEFVTGPVSTMTFKREIDTATNNPNGGNAVDTAFFDPPPPDGVGMSCSNVDIYSYAEVSVTGKLLRIVAKDVQGKIVQDQSDKTPCVLAVPAT